MPKKLRLYTVGYDDPEEKHFRVIAHVAAYNKADAISRAVALWLDAGHRISVAIRRLLTAELHPIERV